MSNNWRFEEISVVIRFGHLYIDRTKDESSSELDEFTIENNKLLENEQDVEVLKIQMALQQNSSRTHQRNPENVQMEERHFLVW